MIESSWDSDEAVPDWAKDHVTASQDGKSRILDVRGMVRGDVHAEFRDNNRNLHNQVEELQTKLAERESWIDPQVHSELQEQLKSVPSADELASANRQLKSSQDNVRILTSEREGAFREIDNLHIRNEVTRAANEAGILPGALSDVLLRASQIMKRDNGQVVAVNAEGNPRNSTVKPTEALTPERWIQEDLKQGAPHLFKSDTGLVISDVSGGIPESDHRAIAKNLKKIADGEVRILHGQ